MMSQTNTLSIKLPSKMIIYILDLYKDHLFVNCIYAIASCFEEEKKNSLIFIIFIIFLPEAF